MSPLPLELDGNALWERRLGAELCTVQRLLGAADLSLGRLYEGHVNAVGLVCRYGTESQIEHLARSVRDGALSAACGADDAHDADTGEEVLAEDIMKGYAVDKDMQRRSSSQALPCKKTPSPRKPVDPPNGGTWFVVLMRKRCWP